MEINLQLGWKTLLDWIWLLQKMERESIMLLCLANLMLPFFLCTMWSLGINLIIALLWLGIKAGVMLFFICAGYYAVLKMTSGKSVGARGGCKCTVMDIFLTVLLQFGYDVPPTVWNYLVPFIGYDMTSPPPPPHHKKMKQVYFQAKSQVFTLPGPVPMAEDDHAAGDSTFQTPAKQIRSTPVVIPPAPRISCDTSRRHNLGSFRDADELLEQLGIGGDTSDSGTSVQSPSRHGSVSTSRRITRHRTSATKKK